jgi:hypothetical protein
MRHTMMTFVFGVCALSLVVAAMATGSAWAGPKARRAPARSAPQERGMASVGGVAEAEKPLEVTGQSRNLSMVLVLKNDKDKIKFVEVRRNFKNEVKQTQF